MSAITDQTNRLMANVVDVANVARYAEYVRIAWSPATYMLAEFSTAR